MTRLLLFGCFAFAVGLVLHTLFVSDGWTHRGRVRADLETLRAENVAIEQKIDGMRRELTALRTRPEVQEHAVRSELGVVRSEDVVIELPEH